jgi:hypothetical protein
MVAPVLATLRPKKETQDVEQHSEAIWTCNVHGAQPQTCPKAHEAAAAAGATPLNLQC